jgi:phosphotriesterase-related protein
MTNRIHTVTGSCSPDELGVTLVHEHLMVGWPGWQADAGADRFDRQGTKRKCVERLLELEALGVGAMIDPCPSDLGRDVELMAEVAQETRVRIICATGLYKEDQGAAAYFKFRAAFSDVVSELTESFVAEIEEGIDGTGIKAGVIKVGTGPHRITDYERMVLTAAARTQKATGVPITTHTDEGTMGREQLAILLAEGADPARIVVGHSCGSADLRYHTDLLDRGAFLGFDRFGLEAAQPDRIRLAALVGLLGIGFERQIVLSHDSVWCWRGRPFDLPSVLMPNWNPTHLFKTILPALREAGVSQEKIHCMLIDNPRRYFGGTGC